MNLDPVSDDELFAHPAIMVAIAGAMGRFPMSETQKEMLPSLLNIAAIAYQIGRNVGGGANAQNARHS